MNGTLRLTSTRGCLFFCVNMPEVPEAWEEHIDTLA